MLSRSSKRKAKRRKALTSPNLDYLRWRFISNGVRTWKARQGAPAYADAPRIAKELTGTALSSAQSINTWARKASKLS